MIRYKDFEQISPFEWEIPQKYNHGMRIPVRVFGSERVIKNACDDNALQQAINVSNLPGMIERVAIMPDVHQGYGFPIGGVAAASMDQGVISPGGIGYDINCGVRLMVSDINYLAVKDLIRPLINLIYQLCPSGVGEKGSLNIRKKDLEDICHKGSSWAYKSGFGEALDISHTEDKGCMQGASINFVSKRAFERGLSQVGSLGSGNHFIEVDVVEKVFLEKEAISLGIQEGCLAVQIHSGSRGFGHQICSDSVMSMQNAIHKYQLKILDRELACAPLNSEEGQAYLGAMKAAANFAFANRQVLAHQVRQAFFDIFSRENLVLNQVYDVAHNIGKIEKHEFSGKQIEVCVHRKGATRCFGPHHPDLPNDYQAIGQPVLIPGSMGTSSWVLLGKSEAMSKSFGSCAHGAGRMLSRSQAKKTIRGEVLRQELIQKGILVKTDSMSGLAEEAPEAYKDIDMVIDSIVGANLARIVAKLRPIAVIKG